MKLVTDDLERIEEERRVSVTLGQPQQGAWTAKKVVVSMHDNWSHLWSNKSVGISMLLIHGIGS